MRGWLQTGWRALVPLVVVGGLALGLAVATGAGADDATPPRSAAQLLADLQRLDPPGYAGVVVQKAGVLAQPLADSTQLSLPTLLSGTHTIKVWYGGQYRQRIAVLSASGETDLFRDGTQVWQWDSENRRATQSTAALTTVAQSDQIPVDGTAVTPDDLARRTVAAIGPTTSVTVGSPTVVAGRPAYRLMVTPPASSDTRIGRVDLSLDGETRMPLAAQVYVRGFTDEPAIDLSFTRISLTVPDDATFRFTPPPDAQIDALDSNDPTQSSPDPLLGPLAVRTEGSGWTKVAVITPANAGVTNQQNLVAQFGDQVKPVSGTWGSGKLLQTALLSMLLLDDGRIVVGAVDPTALYAAL